MSLADGTVREGAGSAAAIRASAAPGWHLGERWSAHLHGLVQVFPGGAPGHTQSTVLGMYLSDHDIVDTTGTDVSQVGAELRAAYMTMGSLGGGVGYALGDTSFLSGSLGYLRTWAGVTTSVGEMSASVGGWSLDFVGGQTWPLDQSLALGWAVNLSLAKLDDRWGMYLYGAGLGLTVTYD